MKVLQCLHSLGLQWGSSLSPTNLIQTQFTDVCIPSDNQSDCDDIQNLGIFVKVLMTGNSELASSQNPNYFFELPQNERKLDRKVLDFISECFKKKEARMDVTQLLQHPFITSQGSEFTTQIKEYLQAKSLTAIFVRQKQTEDYIDQ